MGLGLTSLSVLVLELSARHQQGANSSSLQVSDALGSIVLIGVAGAIFAGCAAGRRTDAGAAYLLIDLVMATVWPSGRGAWPRTGSCPQPTRTSTAEPVSPSFTLGRPHVVPRDPG